MKNRIKILVVLFLLILNNVININANAVNANNKEQITKTKNVVCELDIYNGETLIAHYNSIATDSIHFGKDNVTYPVGNQIKTSNALDTKVTCNIVSYSST